MSVKCLYLILHIPTGEVFFSCNPPEVFIAFSECVEEYEILESFDLNEKPLIKNLI